jgi:hypothetical protein
MIVLNPVRGYQWGGGSKSKNGRADRSSVVYLLGRLDSERRMEFARRCAAESCDSRDRNTNAMPSLLRFLSIIAIIAAVIYAGVYALAHLVQPKPREITVSIPPEKFFKNRQGP